MQGPQEGKPKVGILGSGDVGQALGRGLASRGYGVKIGSRTPNSDKLRDWVKKAGRTASVGSFADAAAYGDFVVLATLGTAVEEVINLAGASALEGKLLIDVTIPLDFSKGMPPGLFVGTTDSLGERIQRKLPRTKVVKAFNTLFAQVLQGGGKVGGVGATVFIAGDDEAANRAVEEIARKAGLKPVQTGGLKLARYLEPLAGLNIALGYGRGLGTDIAPTWNVAPAKAA